jgi:hypothetical protein
MCAQRSTSFHFEEKNRLGKTHLLNEGVVPRVISLCVCISAPRDGIKSSKMGHYLLNYYARLSRMPVIEEFVVVAVVAQAACARPQMIFKEVTPRFDCVLGVIIEQRKTLK